LRLYWWGGRIWEMKDRLIVLEIFSNEIDANVTRCFLETNGITAYVFDNDPAHRFSLHAGTNLDFAVKLMVNSSDFQEAQKLLEEQSKMQSSTIRPIETKSAEDKRKQKKKYILKIVAIVLIADYFLLRICPVSRWGFQSYEEKTQIIGSLDGLILLFLTGFAVLASYYRKK
jgi:hypothetical protein